MDELPDLHNFESGQADRTGKRKSKKSGDFGRARCADADRVTRC